MKPLYDYPQVKMTDHQTKAMLMLSIPDVRQRMLQDVLTVCPRPWKMLNGALDMHGVKASEEVRLFVVFGLALDTPGKIMLYTHALFHIQKRIGGEISMLDFASSFKEGFPDEEALEQAWDDQKLPGGGNEVDQAESYQ